MNLRVRKVVAPFNASNFTHFIRIPLLNQSSSPQIQNTLSRVANDPVSASVPPVAYRPLQRLNLSVAALQLFTEDSRKHAIELLRDLGKQKWQKLFSKLQTASSNTSISSTMNPERPSNEHVNIFNPRPLIVDLVGLSESVNRRGPSTPEDVQFLYTFIKEPMGLLQSFCRSISQEFLAAGLEKRDRWHKDVGDRAFCQTKVMDAPGLGSRALSFDPTLKCMVRHRDPPFDAREMCEKFKDVVWAKGVHLDRVCISELSARDVLKAGECIGKQFHDIVSIPLPGVALEPRPYECLRLPLRRFTAESQGSDRASLS